MLKAFQDQVSIVYQNWESYLREDLNQAEFNRYKSIMSGDAPPHLYPSALRELSRLLARKSKKNVIVLIDEYEAPISAASQFDYFEEVRSDIHIKFFPPEHHRLGKRILWASSPLIPLEGDVCPFSISVDLTANYCIILVPGK